MQRIMRVGIGFAVVACPVLAIIWCWMTGWPVQTLYVISTAFAAGLGWFFGCGLVPSSPGRSIKAGNGLAAIAFMVVYALLVASAYDYPQTTLFVREQPLLTLAKICIAGVPFLLIAVVSCCATLWAWWPEAKKTETEEAAGRPLTGIRSSGPDGTF